MLFFAANKITCVLEGSIPLSWIIFNLLRMDQADTAVYLWGDNIGNRKRLVEHGIHGKICLKFIGEFSWFKFCHKKYISVCPHQGM
jgi:hypothetical protein